MADDNSFGGFTNPAFVTPEQVAQQRQIVNALLGAAQAPDTSKHWTGVLAQALAGMRGQGMLNSANQGQRQILQQGANAIQGAGQGNPYTGVITGQNTNPTLPQANNAASSGDGNALKAAILMQESGNNPNIRSSYAGAVGPGQIMPQTFASIAKPGESINDASDNRNVSGRLLDKYMQDYGDPARAAVAYFSGPGNVAPPGSPTPWIKDKSDGTKSTSSYVSDVMRRIGGSQRVAQNGGGLANFYMTPGIPQELKDNVLKGNTPVPTEDVYGRPGARQGVMGPTTGTPTQNFTPGIRAPATVGPDGGISSTIATPAPGVGGGPSTRDQLGNLYRTGQDFAAQSAVNKTEREGMQSSQQQALLVPETRQILNTMKQDILAHGDKMIFGPTADWVNNLRRSVVQHAPGLLSENDIAGLASADSFDKLSAQLQSIVGRQVGGTDASLLQGMRSVPGQHNSKEGALALIDMLDQVSQQQAKFMVQNRYKIGQPGFDFTAAKQEFFEKHPIENPLTKNKLREDLGKTNNQGGTTKTLNGKTYQQINGKWHEVL